MPVQSSPGSTQCLTRLMLTPSAFCIRSLPSTKRAGRTAEPERRSPGAGAGVPGPPEAWHLAGRPGQHAPARPASPAGPSAAPAPPPAAVKPLCEERTHAVACSSLQLEMKQAREHRSAALKGATKSQPRGCNTAALQQPSGAGTCTIVSVCAGATACSCRKVASACCSWPASCCASLKKHPAATQQPRSSSEQGHSSMRTPC